MEGKLGVCVRSTIRAAQRGPAPRAPHVVYKLEPQNLTASELEGPLLSIQSCPTFQMG